MGHIVELADETLDWKAYYNVGIPKDLSDAKWRVEIGHRAWYLLHGAIDNYPCSLCRDVGSKLLHGLHDMVNIHLDKPAMYPKDLELLAEQSALALKKAARIATVQSLNFPQVRHMREPPMVVRHG